MFCGGFGGYGFGPSGPLGFNWMLLAMGFRLLVFIGLIFLAVKLFKNYTHKSNDAMKILDEGFARGEMTEEEYIKRKAALSQKN